MQAAIRKDTFALEHASPRLQVKLQPLSMSTHQRPLSRGDPDRSRSPRRAPSLDGATLPCLKSEMSLERAHELVTEVEIKLSGPLFHHGPPVFMDFVISER